MTRTLSWILAVSAALAVALSFAPIGAATPDESLIAPSLHSDDEAPPAPPLTAQQLYDKTCAKCHGKKGDGDTKFAKKLLTKGHKVSDLTASKLKLDEILEVTTNGRKKTKMKGYGKRLDAAQLMAISEYVKGLQK